MGGHNRWALDTEEYRIWQKLRKTLQNPYHF